MLKFFFESNVGAFPESKIYPVNFVGSVAAELEEIIREVGSKRGLTIGRILKKPKDGLIEFFEKNQPV